MTDNPAIEIFKAVNNNGGEEKLKVAEVKRNEYLSSKETVASHIREIGRRIISDSENLAFEPSKCTGITITADIAPGNSITKIEYKVQMYADPRTGGNEG